MALTAATTFSKETPCVTNKQINIEVMANEAMARGTPIALPSNVPATHESAHADSENRFTNVARWTVQPPSRNLFVLTPKLSSVTVAANRKDNGLETPWQRGANEAEYRTWRVFTSETLAMIEATGDPASHILGIMN